MLDHIIRRDYRVEHRMTLDVAVRAGGELLDRGWALNEASLEKGPRLGVLGVVLEVDGRPVSSFGCDGVLVSSPTGSTAYAFSAGGPVLWPDLEAILVVPNNAHALFARPMVTSPEALIAIEIEASGHDALVFCDGRRDMIVPAGGRLEVTRCAHPAEVGAAGQRTVHRSAGTQVPAAGHGVARTVVLNEIRIEALGAISAATAEFDGGLTVLTGETGAGKTMVVTGLHLLGGARADATKVRSGAERAVVEGRFTTAELGAAVAAQVDEILDSSGAERDDDGSIIAARSVSRDGPSRAYLGGRSVPAKSLSGFTNELLTLHGQNDQLRLMRPDEQRGALDRYADVTVQLERYRTAREAWLEARRDLDDRRRRARELAQEADRLQFALNEIDVVAPQPGEDEALVADIRRLSELDALRDAVETARAALSGDGDDGFSASPRGRSGTDGAGGHRRRPAQGAGRTARRRARRAGRRVRGTESFPERTAQRHKHSGNQAGASG